MRAFIVACLAIVVLGACAYFGVNAMQQPTGLAYTTDGARINPKWTWRSVFPKGKPAAPSATTMSMPGAPSELAEQCDLRTAYQWIFVDFGDPASEPALCSASQ
jgi:hypothetical protein